MNYDPKNYETVKERKSRFYQQFPDGRIVVELLHSEKVENEALFRASVYMGAQDQEKNLARGIGYAYEIRDRQMKVSNSGKEYESVNFSSWTENAEESAVGRALDNAGFSGNKKASRDEMEKAQRMSKALSADETFDALADPVDDLHVTCEVHNVPLVQAVSKRTQEPYWYHKVGDKMCFGKGVK